MNQTKQTTQPAAEAVTTYLLPEHQIILEEVKLKLRRQGVKASKSKLMRAAINLLGEQPIEQLINRLERDTDE